MQRLCFNNTKIKKTGLGLFFFGFFCIYMKDKLRGRDRMKFILFLTGFGLAVAGGISFIMYFNLLAAGMTWSEYISFTIRRPECYLFFIGWLLMFFGFIE
jgi:hypothetical protein